MSNEISSIDLSGLEDDNELEEEDEGDEVKNLMEIDEDDDEDVQEEGDIGFMDLENDAMDLLGQDSRRSSHLKMPSSFSNLLDECEEGSCEEEDSSSSLEVSLKRKASDLEEDEEEMDNENPWALPPHIQKAADVLDQGLIEARESYIAEREKDRKDKGKEEEVYGDLEFEEIFAADSEELRDLEERKKRLAVLQKLDQATAISEKPKKKKGVEKKKKKLASEKPKKKRQKASKGKKGRSSSSSSKAASDPSIFPNSKDMVGLMAYIQSSGYDIICKGSQESELSDKNKEEVSDEVYALANLFGKRLNRIKDAFIENFTKAIVEKGKTRGQDSAKLIALVTAIQKYRRMITPLGEDLKPKAQSPWTGAEISGQDAHNNCTRIVIVPDEEDDAKGLVFYENNEVTGLYKAIHTLCHFGAYLRIDLDRIINKAKKAVEDSEDPDVLWEAVFDPRGDVPAKKKDQKEGTRLIALKQTLLAEMCKMLRKFCLDMEAPEDPFKCN